MLSKNVYLFCNYYFSTDFIQINVLYNIKRIDKSHGKPWLCICIFDIISLRTAALFLPF